MSSALSKLVNAAPDDKRRVKAPKRATLEEFLVNDARVPAGEGRHVAYSFKGREAMLAVVRTIDTMVGREGAEPLKDSSLALAGGAQFGKTILEGNLAFYLTSQRFLNVGLYLPDDKLAEGIIDTKFRPDIVDQIPWLAEMTQVGKAVTASGKAVNRKGAATITDGERRSNFMAAGLKKVPTTFSFDVTARDEEDDIPPKNAKFVRGRMTASRFRIELVIGTQRVHGRGQQKAWSDGSQGVVLLGPIDDVITREMHGVSAEVNTPPPGWLNPEEAFPGIIRHQLGDAPTPDDPKLAWTGDFRRDEAPDEIVSIHKPGQRYYLADPDTGAVVDRCHPLWLHRRAERIEFRRWSYRISQIGIGAIDLDQIVHNFTLAVADPETMVVFRCDTLALPQSAAQQITPAVVSRAREVDSFETRMRLEPGTSGFAGLDAGDKWWLWVNECGTLRRREIDFPARREVFAASIATADAVRRATTLFRQFGLTALFLDQRPEVANARAIAQAINGLAEARTWPEPDDSTWIRMPGGLTWNPLKKRWAGLRCAVVRFDKKQIGAGIEHAFDIYEEGGATKFVPLIRCNREETIDRAVRSFLTPAEAVSEVLPNGLGLRELPAQLLPIKRGEIDDILGAHVITGSEREKNDDGTLGDYVDGVANHLLLALGYALLAESECAEAKQKQAPMEYSGGNRSRAQGGGKRRGRTAAL